MINITKIYLITNCFNNPNKVYIGKTINSRLKPHQKVFGNQITYDYIDEVNSLNKEDWIPLEKFWIEYFKFLGFDVQNKNGGGSGMSIGSKSFIENKQKPILQYDLEGNFIQEWVRTKDAAIKYNCSPSLINICCNKKLKTGVGFIWRYKNNPLSNNYILPINGNNKKVIQYNHKGEFIKKWDCFKDLAKYFNCSTLTISNCCSGRQKYFGEFILRLEGYPINLPKYKNCNKLNPITQYDLNMNVLQSWDNIYSIENKLKINGNKVLRCCLKYQKTYNNHIWSFV